MFNTVVNASGRRLNPPQRRLECEPESYGLDDDQRSTLPDSNPSAKIMSKSPNMTLSKWAP